jgi:hypothetical protein
MHATICDGLPLKVRRFQKGGSIMRRGAPMGYEYTLPGLFPYCLRHVPQEEALEIVSFLIIENEFGPKEDSGPLKAGSSFAITAGVLYSMAGMVDIWLSQISHDRLLRIGTWIHRTAVSMEETSGR